MSIHRVIVFSDVHFPVHHRGAWAAFRQFHADIQPNVTVADGDIIDLAMLSKYPPEADQPVSVLDEISMAVRELNGLAKEAGLLIVKPGNHEDRWAKAVISGKAKELRGLHSLSMEAQFRMNGLDRSVRWESESAEAPSTTIGKKALAVFHGHKQATGWGVKNLAATYLGRFPTISTIVGHHHRAQLMCRTALGKTTVSIANPHLSGNHEYNTCPDWQLGFTFLEFYGRARLRDCELFTPHLIIMDQKGRFAWNGRLYG